MNYILKDENAIYHECGFSSDNAFFLSIENQNFFITDSRYIFEAKIYVKNAEVIDGERDLVKKVRELIRKSKIKKLIIDPKEWSVEEFDKLQKLNISFSKKPNFSQKKRLIKSDEEIGIIKQAVKLGAKAFDKFEDILKNKDNLKGLPKSYLIKVIVYLVKLVLKQKKKLGDDDPSPTTPSSQIPPYKKPEKN